MQALESAVALRELVLSCNALEGLWGLGALTALTRLDASHNRLTSLAGLTVCQAARVVCSVTLNMQGHEPRAAPRHVALTICFSPSKKLLVTAKALTSQTSVHRKQLCSEGHVARTSCCRAPGSWWTWMPGATACCSQTKWWRAKACSRAWRAWTSAPTPLPRTLSTGAMLLTLLAFCANTIGHAF